MPRKTPKPEWVLRVVGAVLAAAAGLLCVLPIGQPLVRWSYDLPFIFRSHLRPEEAVIVYLDPASFHALKAPTDERLNRLVHAQLLERLTRDGATAVVYDIEFFDEWPDPAVDQKLAAAMRAHGRVVIGSSLDTIGQPGKAQGFTLQRPIPIFREAAAFGAIQVEPEDNFAVRQHFGGGPEEAHRSLAWAAATVVTSKVTQASENRTRARWMNYYGPPGTLPSTTLVAALATNQLSPEFFRGKVVFVGAQNMAGGVGDERDEFATPYTRWTDQFAAGVEVHATAFLNLYRGDWLRRLPETAEAILLCLLGAGYAYGLTWLRPGRAVLAAVLSAALVIAASVSLPWLTRYWFAWAIVLVLQIPIAVFWSVLFGYFQAFVQQRLLEQSLELHLAPARVREIMGRPDLLKPGAEERRISILFSDIANFSKISERMVPADLVRLLNSYFEATLQCIYEADGTVVKLIGDAIYAIWNAPLEQTTHHELICRAALRIRDQLIQFDNTQRGLPMRTRVGLHTGLAYVGNFGSTKRFDFTAIGQSVNLASRLEGLNKHLETDILATRDLQATVEHQIVSRMVGHFRFKGFDRVAEVHELIGNKDCEAAARPWCTTFQEGLYYFQRRDFSPARKAFEQTKVLHPGDGPAKFYLAQIQVLEACPPGGEWTGEIDMKEK